MTELKIVPFKQIKKEIEVRQDVVDALRDILKRAEAGEVQAVYIACLISDDSIATAFSSCDDYFRALGAVEFLKSRVLGAI